MKIQRQWKEFKISDIFSVNKGKYLHKKFITPGKIPYISAKSENNGVVSFIKNNALFPGNRITVEKVTLKAFYQPAPFYCSHDVTVLYSEKIDRFSGVFICNMISRQGVKYSYGRQAQMNVVGSERVFLPVNDGGSPDFKFMSLFVRSVEQKKLHDYFNFISKRISNLRDFKYLCSLEEKHWSCFVVSDLFVVRIGKSINGNCVDKNSGSVVYVTRKECLNGVDGFIDYDIRFLNDTFPVLTIGNETAEPFLQAYPFFTGTKVNILVPIFKASVFSLKFIATCLRKHKGRFSYSFTVNSTRLKQQRIMLPVNDKGEPDYEYMENYIKRIEYLKLKEYIDKKKISLSI